MFCEFVCFVLSDLRRSIFPSNRDRTSSHTDTNTHTLSLSFPTIISGGNAATRSDGDSAVYFCNAATQHTQVCSSLPQLDYSPIPRCWRCFVHTTPTRARTHTHTLSLSLSLSLSHTHTHTHSHTFSHPCRSFSPSALVDTLGLSHSVHQDMTEFQNLLWSLLQPELTAPTVCFAFALPFPSLPRTHARTHAHIRPRSLPPACRFKLLFVLVPALPQNEAAAAFFADFSGEGTTLRTTK